MRITIALCLLLFFSDVQAQDLKNTEWVMIKAEQKDGSKITDPLWQEKQSIKYFFTEDSVFIATQQEYSVVQEYSIRQNRLSIGQFIKYTVDSINDVMMIVTENPTDKSRSVLSKRFVFIKSDYIFDYLKQLQQLTIVGDSLIQCNYQFSPTYKGDIDRLFLSQFSSVTENKAITGYLVISASGNIKKVHLDTSAKFSKEEITRVLSTIYSTRYSWVLPPTPAPYQFEIDFTLSFADYKPLRGIKFAFFSR
jgi:hypothetical protein